MQQWIAGGAQRGGAASTQWALILAIVEANVAIVFGDPKPGSGDAGHDARAIIRA